MNMYICIYIYIYIYIYIPGTPSTTVICSSSLLLACNGRIDSVLPSTCILSSSSSRRLLQRMLAIFSRVQPTPLSPRKISFSRAKTDCNYRVNDQAIHPNWQSKILVSAPHNDIMDQEQWCHSNLQHFIPTCS